MINKGGIYRIENIINNKFYIGSTACFNKRFSSHKYLLKNNKHPNKILQNSWNKYGEHNFKFEILEEIRNLDGNILLEKEQYYSDNLKPEYNLLKIVKSCLGYKHSEETKEKHRKYNVETINNIRNDYKFLSVKELSKKYNITTRYIRSIVENKRWYDENYNPKLSKEDFRKKISKPKSTLIPSKLNFNLANNIREEYTNGYTQVELASKYNVSQGTISKILLNKIWIKNYKNLST